MKFEADGATVGLPGIEPLRWEARFVGRIGASLAFYGHGIVVAIGVAAFPARGAVKPVAGVDLHCRLIGAHGERASRF